MNLITCGEADRRLQLRNGTTAAAIRRGELQGYQKPGGKWYRVNEEDLEDWIKNNWALPKEHPTTATNR